MVLLRTVLIGNEDQYIFYNNVYLLFHLFYQPTTMQDK